MLRSLWWPVAGRHFAATYKLSQSIAATAAPHCPPHPRYVDSISVPTTLRSRGSCTVKNEGFGTWTTALWRFREAPTLDVTYKVGMARGIRQSRTYPEPDTARMLQRRACLGRRWDGPTQGAFLLPVVAGQRHCCMTPGCSEPDAVLSSSIGHPIGH